MNYRLPALLLFIIAGLAAITACKKENLDKSFFTDRAWYISNPASYSSALPAVFGSDSVYYYNSVARGVWYYKDDSHVALRTPFFGADSIEFELLDVRADFLKYRITRSTIHTQVNQVVECDTVP